MIRVIFTLDYEIHGNGEGSPCALMVEPTESLLNLFEEYGAKLTIMADVAEILKFKEFRDTNNRDDYCYDAIENQLRRAIRKGHDVQMHIHSSYFNAHHVNGRWLQDWSEYNFAGLAFDRMELMIKTCKDFLEKLLRSENPNYRCIAFRAANWSVTPSRNVIRALINNGVEIDTSVFKFGKRTGLVSFDYSRAFSQIVPWKADEEDICLHNPSGRLWEIPIYCEKRWIGSFLSLMRIYRAILSRLHKFEYNDSPAEKTLRKGSSSRLGKTFQRVSFLVKRHAWKADFNQCTGHQLINVLEKAAAQHKDFPCQLPFVMIGHSKLCTGWNLASIRPLLKHVKQNDDKFDFGVISDFSPANMSLSFEKCYKK